jgi:hypothetical protein
VRDDSSADRLAAVRRCREQALGALATSQLDSRLGELIDPQDDQLRDLLHDLAYKARKTIDLALVYPTEGWFGSSRRPR